MTRFDRAEFSAIARTVFIAKKKKKNAPKDAFLFDVHPNQFGPYAHVLAKLVYRDRDVGGFAHLVPDLVHQAVARFLAFARQQLQVFVVKDDSLHKDVILINW